jgi:hypothetical protein
MEPLEDPTRVGAATLAGALRERLDALRGAAEEARAGITADRARLSSSEEDEATSSLIAAVAERIDGIEADCRRLAGIMSGFEALTVEVAAPPPPPVAPAPVAPLPPPVAPPAPAVAPPPPSAAPVSLPPPPMTPPAQPAPPAGPPAAFPFPPPPPSEAYLPTPADDGETWPEPIGTPPSGIPGFAGEPDAAVATDLEEVPSEPAEPAQISEGIRLLATQMSVAGASNREIARKLHDDFGVENADALIAQLFGPAVPPPA